MRRIGIVHYRVGRTDGVSLEIEKRRLLLENMGCEVVLIAGPVSDGADFVIPELEFDDPEIVSIKRNAFDHFDDRSLSDDELSRSTTRIAANIEQAFDRVAVEFPTDALLVHNVFSHGRHLPAASALTRHLEAFPQPVLATHHDYFWERPEYQNPRNRWVADYLDRYVPPPSPAVRHVSINSLAARELLARRQIESLVVPDVFDFDRPAWEIDEFNADFPLAVDVRPDDIVVLQATRIVRRKAIELAVDLVASIDQMLPGLVGRRLYNGKEIREDSRVVLILAGYAEDSAAGYLGQLETKIRDSGIEARFASGCISAERVTGPEKRYSLWDAYAHADLVTFPSLQEGWGNQFIEAVFARKPVALVEYPVFEADIRGEGYHYVRMGSHSDVTYNVTHEGVDRPGTAHLPSSQMEAVAEKTVDLLLRADTKQLLDENAKIGRRYHGLQVLERLFAETILK
ncbi:MAG: hypothetical protein ACC655_11560 [Rhodothermia bacterium]